MTFRLVLWVATLLPTADPPRPQATLITLDGPPRSLADVGRDLSRQANVQFDFDRADAARMVQFRALKQPFWELIERLARETDHQLVVAAQGTRVALIRGGYRTAPVSVHGPFRVAAQGTTGRLDFDTGISRQEVALDLFWEPTFKAYYYELDPRSLKAVGPGERPLAVISEGATWVPVGTNTPRITVKLRGIPREISRIDRLEGKIRVVGTTQMLQFAFPLGEAASNQTRAEVTATLASFRRNVQLWTAIIELKYPSDMPEFESFQSFLLDNQMWLLRRDGLKIPVKRFELGIERQGTIPITYYYQEGSKEAPALGDLKDWRLVVRVPGRIVEEQVPFRLQGVTLP